MYIAQNERMLLYIIWEVVCTYSLSGSVLGLTAVIPPAPPGDVLPWLLWWWRPILGIRVVACFAMAVKRSMLSRSHGPHRQLQRVTWPLSLSAPRRAIERVVSPGWTVESRYCFWMKTVYLRREGPDKLQQVLRESRTGHLIRVCLTHTHTHTFTHTYPSYTASSKNKAALPLSTLCFSFLFSSFPLPSFLYTLSFYSLSCLCIDVELHCQITEW